MEEDKNSDNELEKKQNTDISETEDIAQGDIEKQIPDVIAQNEKLTDSVLYKDNNTEPPFVEEENEDSPQDLITVRPVKFQQFEIGEPNRSIKKNLDIMQDVAMHISVELGKAKSTIKEVMDYKEGSIVELDKIAGEQVEVYANNKLVAKGEVIVIEDKFGVRVTSTNLPKNIQ